MTFFKTNELTRRDFVKRTAGLSLAATFASSSLFSSSDGAPAKKPNLVFVFPDQWRGQSLGFMGEDPVKTPQVDAFAKESMVLRQAVANYPLCSPYRAMLLTGKYSHANKVTGNCRADRAQYGVELQESDVCWSDLLKQRGYDLGYIGKWHLDAPREPFIPHNPKWNTWCPPERRHGFDYWYAYGTYDDHNRPMYWETHAGRDEYHFVDEWSAEHEANKAIDYISNRGGALRDEGKPFALVVSMNPPHPPYHKYPERYGKAYEDSPLEELYANPNVQHDNESFRKSGKHYFASITGVDDQFGRILRAIDAAGLKEDTIVVFTSDHGDCMGAHGLLSKNNPYEESMRVPFIIRWPGKIPVGQDDLLFSAPDIYPTLMDLMGLKGDIPSSVHGSSHAGILSGRGGERPSSQLYLKIPSEAPAYGKRGVRTGRYKLVIDVPEQGQRTDSLFDLKADPFELQDIAAERPDLVSKLIEAELKPWLLMTQDPWVRHLA